MKMTASLVVAAAFSLASCTTPTDKDLYKEADKNNDGRLTLAEVNAVGLPRLFNRYDVNGDGNVTLEEAKTVETDFPENEFTSRDLNKDGKVSRTEYDEVAQKKGGLKKRFAAIDTNHDGFIDETEADAHVARMEAGDTD